MKKIIENVLILTAAAAFGGAYLILDFIIV